jgi:hypothetical protein
VSDDYLKHIRQTHADHKNEAWCGQPLTQSDWAFTDIDHATYNGLHEGRLVACKKCVAQIVKALSNGHDE